MRLLRCAPEDGFTNMAVDEAVLRAHAAGESPTLRLYARNHRDLIGYFSAPARY